MQKILRLIQENQSITTHQHLEQTLLKLNNLIDHEYFLFGLSLQTSLTKSETLITDNYPLSWRQQYDESEFMLIDPIVAYSMNNFLPIQWSQMRAQNPHSRVIFEEARINGLKEGFSIPVHGLRGEFGMLSFATSDAHHYTLNAQAIQTSQLIIPLLSQNINNIAHCHKEAQPKASLTARERQCLSWAAEGKSAWEIAQIINTSERTVKFHLANACKKLGATNRYQAITKAILGHYIHPYL
ncbi:LuxR family transcriptional regulator [Vibrio cincinnatiensis]|jgi:LuxR family transcriptional activator of bioluminescence operon|uniref:Regulatory protein, luxR family n=1 Tax=Vibrio cincinnatiensis DSM 19608 TaxID=1123491 RepID=A0A1T4NWW1_VIBCI|nr:LuxR family transcriptional regulator [Vibrio cincinnatiensis]MCG3720899.1 LuxR family transcriptional regulator [Vibrio cincinnatiensis]MCG3733031.1 LuxR family transcriptional regulator [Vibrio cincinnatiensis]MCG3740432.1 LuxR family transcriptional regulator [Vibrio cincinnatiensis]MCG3743934.1 LuxR family transcriptional regulator [Vibrio cincinnatiensis]MCG3765363.1 LuxR family transcriptional regulator [Vibrio cincinnatiensis]